MSWEPKTTSAATIDRADEPYGELGCFHASLAELCRAEMPLPQALRHLRTSLAEDHGRASRRTDGMQVACEQIASELEAGAPFADAYGRRAAQFPPVYRALVEAGLASGDLPGVLDDIARDASLRERTRDRLRRSLEYPCIAALVVLAVGTATILLIAPVWPTSTVTGNLFKLFPSPNRTEIGASNVWTQLAGLGLLALGAIVALLVGWLRKPLDPGAGPRGLRYRLPLLGRLRTLTAKAGFASTMAMLLRRQVPLPRALELCAATCDGDEVRAQVERMAASAARGANLAESVRAGDLVPASLLWFVDSAGSSDAAARALDDIGRVYRQRLERATERAALFAVPLLQLGIGLVVLAFALSYVAPAYRAFEVVFG